MSVFTPFIAQMSGSSGVTLAKLQTEIERIKPSEDTIAHLPKLAYNLRNTTSQLERTLSRVFEGRSVHMVNGSSQGGSWTCEVHLAGRVFIGTTHTDEIDLSSEVWHVHLTFNEEGAVSETRIIAGTGADGNGDAEDKIRKAIELAEGELNSRAWGDSWTRMHEMGRSLKLGRLTYMVTRESVGEAVNGWIKVAQACGILAYRADQPQFAVAEVLNSMIEAQLKEAEEKASGGATSSLATARLNGCAELAEQIEAMRSLLGGVATRLDASVDKLRTSWEAVSKEAKTKKRRKLTPMVAITDLGRTCLRDLQVAQGAVIISQLGRDSLSSLLPMRDNLPAEGQAMVDMLARLDTRPVPFDPADREVLTALVTQGFCEGADPSTFTTPLNALTGAPKPVSEVDVSALSMYSTTLVRHFSE